jgi:hypothetical protein
LPEPGPSENGSAAARPTAALVSHSGPTACTWDPHEQRVESRRPDALGLHHPPPDPCLADRPGREFGVRGGKPHVAGASHGALYALDSLSPVICAGSPVRLPKVMRSIDIAALCLRALGLAPRHDLSASR